MKNFITRDRETGTYIDQFVTREEAEAAIARYEAEDRTNGDYEPDFYEVAEALVFGSMTLTECEVVVQKKRAGESRFGTIATSPYSLTEADARRFFREFAQRHFCEEDMSLIIDDWPDCLTDEEFENDEARRAHERKCEELEEKFFAGIETSGMFDDDVWEFRLAVNGTDDGGFVHDVWLDRETHF